MRQVLGRQEVGLDLVEVSGVTPCLGQCALIADTHLDRYAVSLVDCCFGCGLVDLVAAEVRLHCCEVELL